MALDYMTAWAQTNLGMTGPVDVGAQDATVIYNYVDPELGSGNSTLFGWAREYNTRFAMGIVNDSWDAVKARIMAGYDPNVNTAYQIVNAALETLLGAGITESMARQATANAYSTALTILQAGGTQAAAQDAVNALIAPALAVAPQAAVGHAPDTVTGVIPDHLAPSPTSISNGFVPVVNTSPIVTAGENVTSASDTQQPEDVIATATSTPQNPMDSADAISIVGGVSPKVLAVAAIAAAFLLFSRKRS